VIDVDPSICYSHCSKGPLKLIVLRGEKLADQIFLSAVVTIGDGINAAAS
jgi:hypothetical protein